MILRKPDPSKPVTIYDWAFEIGDRFKELTGYEHNTEIPFDQLFPIAQKIFEKGLNVMIYNHDEGTILFVDCKRFTQR